MEDKRFEPKEAATPAPPALTLDVDDDKLVKFINAYAEKARKFYEKKKIKQRREINKRFYFGRQIETDFEKKSNTYKGVTGERLLKTYEKPFSDNVIKEGEDALRPMVLSRLPDFIVNSGVQGNPASEKVAEAISKVVNAKITSRDMKRLLARAFRHHPVYFWAVIKYYWDPQAGNRGDTVYEVIHPENIIADMSATEADQEKMQVIIHYVEKPLKTWIMLFPKFEDKLIEFARSEGAFSGELNEESLAANLKIAEVWFDWSEKKEEFDPENPEFNFFTAVCWKIKDTILDKKLNPNWDWEGSEQLFFNGRPITDELIPQISMMGMDVPGIERKKIYKNFFKKPRKPFIFVAHEQWGEGPMDETSRVEENLLLQENYDVRGMQVTKMIDDSRGKHVYSTMSGLKRETVENMDVNNPDQDMVLDGDLRQIHSFINKEQPSNAMFADLTNTRERILARQHVHGASRGEVESQVATTNQIAREADFTAADDIRDDTVDGVAMQVAESWMHMAKLRYTKEHFEEILGRIGQEMLESLQEDMIEDGMVVTISSSGTDKLKAERQAKDEAQLGLIDPLSYYRDIGRDDPEKRAEMLFLFQTAPELYYKRFVQGEEVQGIADEVAMFSQQRLATAQGQSAGQPGMAPGMMAGSRMPPMQPTPQNTGAIPEMAPGSPRNLIGRAGQAISGLFNRGGI